MTQYVYGKNVVKQLILNHKKIYEIIVADGIKDKDLLLLIDQNNIPYRVLSRKRMDQMMDEHHQGIAAKIDDYKIFELDELILSIPHDKTPLLILLDGIEDPHNLGAILRTCDSVGADGIIIGKHRNVKLTPTVAKVSTGAIDTVKVAMVTNLSQTIQQLKKQGYWVIGTDMNQSIDYRKGNYDVPLVLVIGSEGFGISSLVRKNCDYCIHLPMQGSVTSLNASVATGILLYEIFNQRNPLK